MNDPKPASGPTNGRPWPGTRVKIKATGVEAVVDDYEYGWNSDLFPILIHTRAGSMTRMVAPDQVRKIGSTVTPLPSLPVNTNATVGVHCADNDVDNADRTTRRRRGAA